MVSTPGIAALTAAAVCSTAAYCSVLHLVIAIGVGVPEQSALLRFTVHRANPFEHLAQTFGVHTSAHFCERGIDIAQVEGAQPPLLVQVVDNLEIRTLAPVKLVVGNVIISEKVGPFVFQSAIPLRRGDQFL